MSGSLALSAALVAASIVASASSAAARARVYAIEGISQLRAEVAVDEDSRQGTVTIVERRSGKFLLTTTVDDLRIDETAVRGGPSGAELPYAEQGIVQYVDVDFDGRRDLAILAGHDACYGAPSYRVFLRDGASFRQSAPFTRLASDFCGMFDVDPVRRRLQTFDKSGCCLHASQEYSVVGGAPQLVASVEVDTSDVYAKTTRRSRGKPQRIEYALQRDLVERVLLTFELAGKSGQRLVLFAAGRQLDCALVQGEGARVRLSYRLDSAQPPAPAGPRFSLGANGGKLSYRAKRYTLVVHDRPDRLGVTVLRQGQATFLAGLPETREGGLSELLPGDFDNVSGATPERALR